MSENDTDGNDSVVDSTECPTCGRDDFSTPRAMKVHHTSIHGESIAGVDAECAQCGSEFRAETTHAKRNDNNFCSRDCYSAWLGENNRGERHPTWKPPVTVNCSQCGAPKETTQYKAETVENHFCNNECFSQWQSENVTGEEHPNWSRVDDHCTQCGAPITVQRSIYESNENNFCSTDCYAEWCGGSNSHRWKGGHCEYYGSHWKRIRDSVVERDDYRCQSCGMDDEEHQERYSYGLHVHHIQRRASFDTVLESDTMDNLVTLCCTCHGQWEGIPLRPSLK